MCNYKNNVKHISCIIYHSCGQDYIGETIRNGKVRWNEHDTGKDKKFDCFKHLKAILHMNLLGLSYLVLQEILLREKY